MGTSSTVDRDAWTRRHLVTLLLAGPLGAQALPALAGDEPPQQGQDGAEFEKLSALLAFVRDRNARDYAITSPDGIDDGRYVEIGGLPQWITIRGEERKNPVLLFLHGGPGDATNPWGYAGFRTWLRHFTVVQWDQRGAGRTLGKNGASSAATITLDRMTRDGIELAEWLRRFLGKDRLLLVGHSWGSILGVFMAKARPDLFSAFIGTAQVADGIRNYAVAFDALLKKAASVGEPYALADLRGVGPPPYSDGRGYAIQRKWSNLFEGADFFIASMLGLAFCAPGYSLRDVNDWGEGQMLSAERLVPETSRLDAKTLGGEFALPVFVIQGAEDFTTPTSLARAFVDSIRAPRKAFASLEGGGHFAVFLKSSAFLGELLKLTALL